MQRRSSACLACASCWGPMPSRQSPSRCSCRAACCLHCLSQSAAAAIKKGRAAAPGPPPAGRRVPNSTVAPAPPVPPPVPRLQQLAEGADGPQRDGERTRVPGGNWMPHLRRWTRCALARPRRRRRHATRVGARSTRLHSLESVTASCACRWISCRPWLMSRWRGSSSSCRHGMELAASGGAGQAAGGHTCCGRGRRCHCALTLMAVCTSVEKVCSRMFSNASWVACKLWPRRKFKRRWAAGAIAAAGAGGAGSAVVMQASPTLNGSPGGVQTCCSGCSGCSSALQGRVLISAIAGGAAGAGDRRKE